MIFKIVMFQILCFPPPWSPASGGYPTLPLLKGKWTDSPPLAGVRGWNIFIPLGVFLFKKLMEIF
jgi:hypothetical protein